MELLGVSPADKLCGVGFRRQVRKRPLPAGGGWTRLGTRVNSHPVPQSRTGGRGMYRWQRLPVLSHRHLWPLTLLLTIYWQAEIDQ